MTMSGESNPDLSKVNAKNGNAVQPRPSKPDIEKGSKISSFLGKAKSKVKLFNGPDNQTSGKGVQTQNKNGVVSRVKNLVSNKTPTSVANNQTNPRKGKGTTTTPKHNKGVSRCVSEPAIHGNVSSMRESPSVATIASTPMANANGTGGPTRKRRIKFFRRSRNLVNPSSSSSSTAGSAGGSNSRKNSSRRAPNAKKLSQGDGSVTVGLSGLEIGDAVFALDIRTQNTRLVTARQRQEIYALNRIMTRLENEKFKRFCQEKGFKGDLEVESDHFM